MNSEQWKYTAGDFLTTQKKLETVAANIEGQWERQTWMHQRKQNNLLRSLIKDLKERVEVLEAKSNS